MTQEFNIKNMVCNRCVKVLRNELAGEGLSVQKVEFGILFRYEQVVRLKLIEIK